MLKVFIGASGLTVKELEEIMALVKNRENGVYISSDNFDVIYISQNEIGIKRNRASKEFEL